MKTRSALILILFLFGSLACKEINSKKGGKQNTPPISKKSAALITEVKTFQKKSEGCANVENGACADIKLTYPIFSGGNKGVAKIINDTLLMLINDAIAFRNNNVIYRDVEALINNFIKDYEKQLTGPEPYDGLWNNESVAEVISDNAEVICLAFTNFSYTGGAHGNYYTVFYNFEKESGNVIDMEDMVNLSPGLSKLFEEKARAFYEIPAGEDLKNAGFYYDEEHFPITDNMAILQDSLLFLYNIYEITPYVMGQIELQFAKSELEAHLK